MKIPFGPSCSFDRIAGVIESERSHLFAAIAPFAGAPIYIFPVYHQSYANAAARCAQRAYRRAHAASKCCARLLCEHKIGAAVDMLRGVVDCGGGLAAMVQVSSLRVAPGLNLIMM